MSENIMTPAPWKVSPALSDKQQIAILNTGKDQHLIAEVIRGNGNSNAAAIVSAINNTYGAGINPEGVKDLLEALKEAKRMYEELQPAGGWQGVYDEIEAAIKKASL